jgi:hypothetical protein
MDRAITGRPTVIRAFAKEEKKLMVQGRRIVRKMRELDVFWVVDARGMDIPALILLANAVWFGFASMQLFGCDGRRIETAGVG